MKKMLLLSGSVLLLILFIIVFIFGYLKYNQTFNDVASMKTKIAKELETEQVSIFDIQGAEGHRLVGYTFDNKQGYAVFEQNEDGDYQYEYVRNTERMRSRNKDIYYYPSFLFHRVILNNNEDLRTIEFIINFKSNSTEEIKTIEINDHPSLIIFEKPNRSHHLKMNFYDGKGNLIE